MRNTGAPRYTGITTILILAAVGPPCLGQEKSVFLGGELYSGFLAATNRNGVENRLSFVPVGVDLDLSGYLGAPGFLDYRVQPKLTASPQATEAGFFGGNGVTLTTTFLGRRPFPLHLTYKNLVQENVYFGGITQVSGFRSKNHDRGFGLNWELRTPRLPEIVVDFNTSDLKATPDTSLLPDYSSLGRNAGLHIKKSDVHGWDLSGQLQRLNLASTFATPPSLLPLHLDQRNSVAQTTATRPLWAGSRLTLNGGTTKYENTFSGATRDQSHRFASGFLSFGEGSKWQGNFRSAYTSNLIGSEAARLLSRRGSSADDIGPEAVILLPLSARISQLSNSGYTRYEFLRGWSVFGGVSHDRVRAPNTGLTAPNSDYSSGNGGVRFTHRFSWLMVGGQYGRTLGRISYRDLKGRLSGQDFSVTAQSGRAERLEATATYSQNDQQADQVIQTRGGGKSADFTLGRHLQGLGLQLRGGAGYDRNFFRDSGQRHQAQGLSFHASIQHRYAQVSYSRRNTDGTTLLGFLTGPLQNPLLAGMHLASVLSAFRMETFSMYSSPLKKLELNLLWIRSNQEFDRRPTNFFEQLDVNAGYRFRLLKLQLGYVVYDQNLLGYLPFYRDRVYVRISRDFRVL